MLEYLPGTGPTQPPYRPAAKPPAAAASHPWLPWVGMLALAGGMAYQNFGGTLFKPNAETKYNAAGRAYAAALGPAFAVGFNAYAAAIEAGKSMDEATKVEQGAFQAARSKAFQSTVQPVLDPLVTEGGEPSDKAGFVKAARAVAKGAE